MSAAETPGGSLTRIASAHPHRPALLRTRTAEPLLPPAPEGTSLLGRRVLVVGRDYGSAGGPSAPYTTGIAEHLATRAAAVTVVTTSSPSANWGPRPAGTGSVPGTPTLVLLTHRVGPAAASGRARRAGAPRQESHGLWRELAFAAATTVRARTLAADLIVAVGASPGGAAAAARLATRRGVPLVTIVQGISTSGDDTGRLRRPGPARPAARTGGRPLRRAGARLSARAGAAVTGRLERYALRRSSEVAVTNEAFCPAMLAAGVDPGHLHLLPTWTRVPATTRSTTEARAELGWPTDRFTVVHAGPMSHRQGLAGVVEAARLLADRAEEARRHARHDRRRPSGRGLDGWDRSVRAAAVDVVLVGDGSQRAALEQQSFGLSNVRFADAVGEDTQALVLAAADVLLLAEPGTGAPAAPGQLAGYLAAGRPVLAAVHDPSPLAFELRRAGEAGLRVDPDDPAALADAIVGLQAAPQQRGLMSRTALRYARAHLHRAASLRRLELVVDAALAGRPEGMTATVPHRAPRPDRRPVRRSVVPPTPPEHATRVTVDAEAAPNSTDAGRGC